jgi:hypothetical protein
MEVNKDSVGNLKFRGISQTFLNLVAQLFTSLGAKLAI